MTTRPVGDSGEKLPALSWQGVRRVLELARPHLALLAVAGFLSICATAVSLLLPYFAKTAVDQVVKTHSTTDIDRAAFGIIGLFLVAAVFSFVQFVIIARTGHQIVNDLRKGLFAHLQKLPIKYYDHQRSGDLTSFISNDVDQVQQTVTSDLVGFTGNIIKLVGGVIMAVTIDWRLCTFVVILLVIMMFVFIVLGRALRKINRESLDRLSEAIGQMSESLGQIRLVKAFAREEYEEKRTGGKLDQVFALNVKSSTWEAGMGTVAFTGFITLLLGVLWYGGRGVLTGSLTLGSIVGFFLVVTIISGPMGELASLYTRLQRAVGAADRLFEILDEPAEIDLPETVGVTFPVGPGEVSFSGINFRYVDDQPVLKDFSLRLIGGGVTALVGPSGSGKSTVSSLLYRFYDPQLGVITIDGVPIDSMPRSELRAQVGVVPQETLLFSGTIRENIRYGRLGATDEEVEAAAKAANVHQFVTEFTKGYETLIGERGITLSGGQRQRVAIARAILKNPRILILDEATSALDAKSESLVQEALERLMEGRTTLVIAHRLSTVVGADQIAVLKNGQVAELGTHEALMAKKGVYAELQNITDQFAVASSHMLN